MRAAGRPGRTWRVTDEAPLGVVLKAPRVTWECVVAHTATGEGGGGGEVEAMGGGGGGNGVPRNPLPTAAASGTTMGAETSSILVQFRLRRTLNQRATSHVHETVLLSLHWTESLFRKINWC